ncbi:hypothetical protein ABZ918_16675 [Streptomyces viridosporus]|uniref:hypothetical protein n=1 Tax=Streptomyces TaxID=1883 RepID=UPI00215B1EB6|nr:hypothetical protein [Streptomyces sp. NWU49]
MPPQTWIRFDAAERRRYWWRAGLTTLTFFGMAWAVGLSASAAERWWWVGGVAVLSLPMIFSMINQGYGATLLTTEGMELHTLFRCRSVSWGEVAGIEKRCLPARSGTRSEVRVVRVRGRALTVPGTLTARMYDPEFEAKLAVIRQYRAHAADS